MKKFRLLIALIVSLLLTTCVFSLIASAATIKIENAGIDEVTNKVLVKGKVENGMTNTAVTLLILKIGADVNDIKGSDILHIEQKLLSEIDGNSNVAFSFDQFHMPVVAKTGKYKVMVTGEIGYNMDRAETSFDYVGLDMVYLSLLAIDTADTNNISNNIIDNAKYLMIDENAYKNLSDTTKPIINTMLVNLEMNVSECSDYETNEQSLNKLNIKITEFRNNYKKIISIGQFRDASTALEVKSWMDTYVNKFTYGQSEYDIDYDFDGELSIKDELTKRNKIYAFFSDNLTQDLRNNFFELLSNKNDLNSINEIREAFYASTLLIGIEALPWGKTKYIIETFPDKFNLNYTDFNDLSDASKDKVYNNLSGNGYPTFNAVKEAFENNATMVLKNQNALQSSISGSSSDKKTSGSVSFTPTNKAEDNNSNTNSNFSDISGVRWANDAINELYKKGILNGKSQGVFAPNDNVTRAEFIKILMGAFGLVDENATTELIDVNKGEWYYKYIASAQKYGITFGKSNGEFGVNDLISRQDMVVLLNRATKTVGLELNSKEKQNDFSDFGSIDSYAQAAVKEFTDAGIVNGMTNNTFSPKETATRAQAAKLIYSLLQLM